MQYSQNLPGIGVCPLPRAGADQPLGVSPSIDGAREVAFQGATSAGSGLCFGTAAAAPVNFNPGEFRLWKRYQRGSGQCGFRDGLLIAKLPGGCTAHWTKLSSISPAGTVVRVSFLPVANLPSGGVEDPLIVALPHLFTG
jgi:hypothetical protein